MGVYIKGMEMPTDDMKNIMILADGRVFQFSGYGNPKPLGTAVPVPAHGDLINRDALDVIGYCDIPQGCEDTFDSGVMWLAERIDELPTIIPAEDGV